MTTITKNGAKMPRVAQLHENPKNILTQLAQDHDFMSQATIDADELQPLIKKPQVERARRTTRIHEDGNSNNVYNFNMEIASVIVFGPKYAPSNPSLVVTALQNLLDDAQQSMLDVNIHFNAFKQTLDNRHTLYERMCGEATRILAELRASGASSATIDKAKSYNNKIQGRRIKKVDPNAGEKTISASQTSFAQRFYHFDGLVGVCEHEPLYNPSEALLQIASLKAYLLQLKSANAAVATAKAQIAKARRDRNSTLYAPISGMVDTAIRVKEYTKAIFGFKSPEYRQIAHLKFRNLVKL